MMSQGLINDRLEEFINKFGIEDMEMDGRPSNKSRDVDLEDWLKYKLNLEIGESPFDLAFDENFESPSKEFTQDCPINNIAP